MKTFILVILVLSLHLHAGDESEYSLAGSPILNPEMAKIVAAMTAGGNIVDDGRICNPIRNNNFPRLIKNLDKYYHTTLKESYFKIKCSGGDLFDLIIKNPADRYFSSLYFQRYFEKKEKIPVMFSRILMSKVDGLDAIKRIDYQMRIAVKAGLTGSYLKKLKKMKKKYIEYLKKYPVPEGDGNKGSFNF